MPGAGAAQRHEHGPAGPDGLDGELAAVLARIRRLLGRLEREPGRDRDITELIALERHVAEDRAAREAGIAEGVCREAVASAYIELGRQMERASRPPAPAPRRRTQQPGQHPLMRVVPG
jgi:hypothetical protein